MAEVDLTNPGRRTSQRRITNNRDGVLPSRRNTEAPSVAIRADLRTATRGDGGADELRRTLDGFLNAGERAFNAQTQGNMDRYRGEAAEGALAAAAGEELSPELQRSRAAQTAFYKAKGEASFTSFATETKAAVEDALNQGLGPDEVERLVMDRVRGYRDDFLTSVPDPLAQRDAAMRLSAMGSELEAEIAVTIRERIETEFVETTQGNIQARIRNGEPLNVEGYITELRAGGRSPAEAKQDALTAVLAVALDRDDPDPELAERLLESVQADGKTPTFNAAEQLQIQDRITQSRNLQTQLERERREEARDALVGDLFLKAIDGEIVDEQIIAAGRDGTFEPQEVAQYLGLLNGLRDAVEEGHADEDFILEVDQRVAVGNPPSNAQVLAWQREGRFGTGRAGLRASIQFLSDASVARSAGRGGGSGGAGGGSGGGSYMSARSARTNAVTLARAFLNDTLGVPEEPTRYQRNIQARAGLEFNRRVVGGEEPMAVAESVSRAFGTLIRTNGRASPRTPPPVATVTRDASGRLVMAD